MFNNNKKMERATKLILLFVLIGCGLAVYFTLDKNEDSRKSRKEEQRQLSEEEYEKNRDVNQLAMSLDRIIDQMDLVVTPEEIARVDESGSYSPQVDKILKELSLKVNELEAEYKRITSINPDLKQLRGAHHIEYHLPEFTRDLAENLARADGQTNRSEGATIYQTNHLSKHIHLNQQIDPAFDTTTNNPNRATPSLPNQIDFQTSTDIKHELAGLKKKEESVNTFDDIDTSAFITAPISSNNGILSVESAEAQSNLMNDERPDDSTRTTGVIRTDEELTETEKSGANDLARKDRPAKIKTSCWRR